MSAASDAMHAMRAFGHIFVAGVFALSGDRLLSLKCTSQAHRQAWTLLATPGRKFCALRRRSPVARACCAVLMLAAAVLTAAALLSLPTRRATCRAAVATAAWRGSSATARPTAVSPRITVVQGSGTDGRTYGVAECGPLLPRAVIGSEPTLERVELALTLRSGYLQDPPSIDGLAHLCEHVTLAADPADLNGFLEERVGSLNAFTAEETTTFHLEFDVDGDPRTEVGDVCRRFAALFDSRLTSVALVRQELPRIHAEWDAFERAPARTALEIAALKQRTDAANGWRRLGRGNAGTMPLTD